MAKVNGPLFSLGASGQLAKAIVYSIWKGRPYVREYVTPANPNSLAQRATRATVAYLSSRWSTLSTSDKDSWNALADAASYSPFNAYSKAGLNAIGEQYAPSDAAAQARTAPTQDAANLNKTSGTGGVVSGNVNLIAGTAADVAAIVIQASAGAAQTVHGVGLLGYVTPNGTTAVSFEFTGLDPAATYTITAYTVSITGGVGVIENEAA